MTASAGFLIAAIWINLIFETQINSARAANLEPVAAARCMVN